MSLRTHDATKVPTLRTLKKALSKVTKKKAPKAEEVVANSPRTESTTNTTTSSSSPLNVKQAMSILALRDIVEKQIEQEGLDKNSIGLYDAIIEFKKTPDGYRETAAEIYEEYMGINADKKVAQLDDLLVEDIKNKVSGTSLFVPLDSFDDIEIELQDTFSEILVRFIESPDFDPCMKLLIDSVM
jgi:hypothetical protein